LSAGRPSARAFSIIFIDSSIDAASRFSACASCSASQGRTEVRHHVTPRESQRLLICTSDLSINLPAIIIGAVL
ncbi:MAG: hypothetical protein ACLQSW_08360, partial [Syntrophobacteraceae bacterium]